MERYSLALATLLLVACARRDGDAPSGPDASAGSSKVAASPDATAPEPEPRPTPRPLVTAPVRLPTFDASSITPFAVKDASWKTYRGDRFSVLFPGEPKVTELPAEDDKAGYTEALLDVPGGQVSFAAGFTEHTAEQVEKPDQLLDERVDAPRRGTTDVLHKRSVTLPGGQPGRVLILRRNISGTPLRVYSRLYLVGRRMYSLIVSTLDVGGVSEDVVKRFMESFKLL